MANLPLTPSWDLGVYQYETDDPVEGGLTGVDNKPLINLGNRTEFIKQQMDKAVGGNVAGADGFSLKMLNGNADQIDGPGRDLLKVLGVSTIAAAMAAIRVKCNGDGTPDFSGLMIGDYIDGISLTAVPAENSGEAGQAWNNTYKNNRIVLSGFNTYKGFGDTEVTKNHLLFTPRNVWFSKRVNPTNDNAGGYPASELRAFMEGVNGDGTGDYVGSTTVTTAALLNALIAQLNGGGAENYILPIRKYHSIKGAGSWKTYSLWLPTELEVFGYSTYGDEAVQYNTNVQFPIYAKSGVYRIKRKNGSRWWWWEHTPWASGATNFCDVSYYGDADCVYASNTDGGVAPAFCVA
jgi:hypothetical protein